jgi:hypothetical protein
MNDIKKIDKKKPKAFLFLFYNKNNIIAMWANFSAKVSNFIHILYMAIY